MQGVEVQFRKYVIRHSEGKLYFSAEIDFPEEGIELLGYPSITLTASRQSPVCNVIAGPINEACIKSFSVIMEIGSLDPNEPAAVAFPVRVKGKDDYFYVCFLFTPAKLPQIKLAAQLKENINTFMLEQLDLKLNAEA